MKFYFRSRVGTFVDLPTTQAALDATIFDRGPQSFALQIQVEANQ
jgi:hypothetical protein